MDYRFNFAVTAKTIVAPHRIPAELADLLNIFDGDVASHPLAKHLNGKKKVCILLGAGALHHPQAALIRTLAQKIAQRCEGKTRFIDRWCECRRWLVCGAVPHRHAGGSAINHAGLNAYEMLQKPRKAYLLLNVEPELDCANAHVAVEAIKTGKICRRVVHVS